MNLGDLNTIGDVTQMIKDMLVGLDVTLESPAALPKSPGAGEDFKKMNLFLYQVTENEFAKNQSWVTHADGKQEYPPLSLNLRYLITPYASDVISAHQVLTHAMQMFYVNTTLTDSELPGSLRLVVERLTVNLCQMSLEELTRIWNALQTPYRLSVVYEVRVVLVKSMVEQEPSRVEAAIHVHQQR